MCSVGREVNLWNGQPNTVSVSDSPIFPLITEGFGQVVVISVAGQPFSADAVIIQNPKPNVRNVIPMKTIHIYRDSAGRTREDVSVPRDPTANQVANVLDPIAGVSLLFRHRRQDG